jgi:hypothetical protein
VNDEQSLAVHCRMADSRDGDWRCEIRLDDASGQHGYSVSVSRTELERYGRGQVDPTMLVAESFRFLLEREGPDSILTSFAISDIERYFPEFPIEMRRRHMA